MKAIRVHAFGGNDQLRLDEVPDPVAGEGEYVVKIHAAGVNPVDWKIVRGYLAKAIETALPFVPGWDLSGEIVARGHGARRFEVGDRVYGYARRPRIDRGTYAEAQAVPEYALARMPSKASFVEAAAMPLVYLTSLQSLRAAGAAAGQRVLVLGASGGTGMAGVQLARALGARVEGVASARNHAWLLEQGAAAAHDYAGATAAGLVGVEAGAYDVVYDCVGGDTLRAALPALREGGHLVSITTSKPPEGWARPAGHHHYVFVEPHAPQLDELARWFDEGALRPIVSQTFALEQAADALAASESQRTRGKIVLTM